MKKFSLLLCLLLLISFFASAQIPVAKNVEQFTPAAIRLKLLNALDTLVGQVNKGEKAIDKAGSNHAQLNNYVFDAIRGIENNATEKDSLFYKPQVINLYPVAENQYFISVAFINKDSLRAIINFIASVNGDNVTFSIPLYYQTRNWKTTVTGNITYHYPDHINLARATVFNAKNSTIATKLGLQPDKFDFYLCDNYQEVLKLFGFEYDSESAGVTNEGDGPGAGTIFSVMHNEDFSHDVFHYYSAKVRTHPRNAAAEEGFAYSWGNAYYADDQGEMITQQQLVKILKTYLEQHPQPALLELFRKNPMIFYAQTKVRSLIASLICDAVENKNGIAGVKALLNCGSGDDNFFKVTNDLIGLNTVNFNAAVGALLADYKKQ